MATLEKTLNESIIDIRVKLQNSKLKKSGKNSFAGFDYFELADFLPKLNELMKAERVNDLFTIENEYATLILKKGQEEQVYRMPFIIFETPTSLKKDKTTGEVKEVKQMQDIQYLGALNTYYKRYLYLNAFGITDGDVIDRIDNTELQKTVVKATPKQIETIKKLVPNLEVVYKHFGIDKLEELTVNQASEVIAKKKKQLEG